jgi:hypothetical protein
MLQLRYEFFLLQDAFIKDDIAWRGGASEATQ